MKVAYKLWTSSSWEQVNIDKKNSTKAKKTSHKDIKTSRTIFHRCSTYYRRTKENIIYSSEKKSYDKIRQEGKAKKYSWKKYQLTGERNTNLGNGGFHWTGKYAQDIFPISKVCRKIIYFTHFNPGVENWDFIQISFIIWSYIQIYGIWNNFVLTFFFPDSVNKRE